MTIYLVIGAFLYGMVAGILLLVLTLIERDTDIDLDIEFSLAWPLEQIFAVIFASLLWPGLVPLFLFYIIFKKCDSYLNKLSFKMKARSFDKFVLAPKKKRKYNYND